MHAFVLFISILAVLSSCRSLGFYHKDELLPLPSFEVKNLEEVEAYHKALRSALVLAPDRPLPELRAEAQERAEEFLLKGQRHYGFPEKPLGPIKWVVIGGGYAGRAYGETFQIYLDEILFLRNYDSFMNDVIPHEVAHLLFFQKYEEGVDIFHSVVWAEMMKTIAGFSNDSHDLDIGPSCELVKDLFLARLRCSACRSCSVAIYLQRCNEGVEY